MLRTTRLAPIIFPTMITVSRVTECRLIITVPRPICGDRTFVTIRGMTIIGIQRWCTPIHTGTDIILTTAGVWDGVMAIRLITVMAIAEATEGITLPAEHGLLAVPAAALDSLELKV
jgi:hypothetical protein